MRTMCAFASSCACTKSYPGIFFPLKHSLAANDSVCGQQRPWSDFANAQADLGRRCPHMPKDTFLHGAAKIWNVIHVSHAFIWIVFTSRTNYCISITLNVRERPAIDLCRMLTGWWDEAISTPIVLFISRELETLQISRKKNEIVSVISFLTFFQRPFEIFCFEKGR